MALIWLMIGASIGIMTSGIFRMNHDHEITVKTLYPSECQISHDYHCKNVCECKGNPTLCESAVRK